MSPSEDLFVDLDRTKTRQLSTATSGSSIQTSGTGTLKISGSLTKLHLNKAIHEPTLRHTLMLAHRITESGHSVFFQGDTVIIYNADSTIATGKKNPSGLYSIDLLDDTCAFDAVATPAETKVLPYQTWHEHLGHLGQRNIQKLPTLASGIVIQSSTESNAPCETCPLAKQMHLSHPRSSTVYHPGILTHTDVIGPFPLGYYSRPATYPIVN